MNLCAKKTIAFGTLGCKLNQFESDCLVSEFRKNGYNVVPLSEKADVYIVNTCTVTNKSDAKSRNMMYKLSRKNPEALLFVTGCYAETDRDTVEQIDGVNYVISNDKKYKLFQIVSDALNNQMVEPEKVEGNRFLYEPGENTLHTRGYLKIQDGCDEKCSYCKIPLARGLAESRPAQDVLGSVQKLLGFGYREIILTGINIGDYSSNDMTLSSLLTEILSLDGDFRVHLSSIEPNKVTEDLIEVLDHPKLCTHLHIPLQSGSDIVLKSMGRSYDRELYKNVILAVYQKHSLINITTDTMVGFPGETENDFMKSLELLTELRVSYIHTFKYSLRAGTPAAAMNNQVPEQVKTQRSKILRDLSQKLNKDYNTQFVGKTLRVITEKCLGEELYTGHSENYLKVRFRDRKATIGEFVNVTVDKVVSDGVLASVTG